MNWFEVTSLLLNLLLGGSLLVTLVTLKSVKKKANAEAEGEEIENEKKAAEVMKEYIVEPLQGEIKKLRRSITRFEKAVERVSDCEHKDNCPVRREFQKQEDEQ